MLKTADKASTTVQIQKTDQEVEKHRNFDFSEPVPITFLNILEHICDVINSFLDLSEWQGVGRDTMEAIEIKIEKSSF